MSNKFKWPVAGCVLLSLILLMLPSLRQDAPAGNMMETYRYQYDTLHCAVATDSRLSYDMLQYFGDHVDAVVDISTGSSDLKDLDSLVHEGIDILVTAQPLDSIIASDSSGFLASRQIRNNIHWLVSCDDRQLLFMINSWLDGFMNSSAYDVMEARYYPSYNWQGDGNTAGRITPFDDLLKQYAQATGIDWLLLSALMYKESRYYAGAEYKEAKGLMQVKDVTAARYGVSDLFTPEDNIKAGSYHMRYLIKKYSKEGLDTLNVIKFALAAYNAGDNRIEQCRQHAKQEGKNPDDWEEVVTTFATNDSFEGVTTTAYVRDILASWEKLKSTVY